MTFEKNFRKKIVKKKKRNKINIITSYKDFKSNKSN